MLGAVALLGRLILVGRAIGISSRIPEWSAVVRKRVADNVALYRRIRGTIAGADVYHQTPAPRRNDPTGWTALEYVQQEGHRAVVLAYRTEKDCRPPMARTWPLVGSEYGFPRSGAPRSSSSQRDSSPSLHVCCPHSLPHRGHLLAVRSVDRRRLPSCKAAQDHQLTAMMYQVHQDRAP